MRRLFDWLDRFLGKMFFRTIGVFFVAGGLFAMYGGRELFSVSASARGWPTAEGAVLESSVLSSSRGSHKPFVRYSYEVDGKKLEGHGLHYPVAGDVPPHRSGGGGITESWAREEAARFPKGAPVRVHYRPDDPKVSVVEPRFSWWGLFPLGAGAAFVALGTWCLRTRRKLSEIEG